MEVININLEKGYNERLYEGDALRRFYHKSRFKFLSYAIKKYNIHTVRVLEIGCGDAKSLEFLNPKPIFYIGIDANWEGLLDIAKKTTQVKKTTIFFEGTSPKSING